LTKTEVYAIQTSAPLVLITDTTTRPVSCHALACMDFELETHMSEVMLRHELCDNQSCHALACMDFELETHMSEVMLRHELCIRSTQYISLVLER